MSSLCDPELQFEDLERATTIAWERTELVREVVNRWRVDEDWRRVPISRTCYTVFTPRDKVGDLPRRSRRRLVPAARDRLATLSE